MADSFTVESAVARALQYNADLAAARLGIDEARARLVRAGRLPEPEVEAGVKPNLAGREYAVEVGLVQRFPLTQRLRHQKAVSQVEVEVAELEVREAARALAVEVRLLAVKWQVLQAQRELKRGQILHSRELAVVAAGLAAAGEGSSLEVAELELKAGQVEVELLDFDREEASLAGVLRPLLGLPAEEAVVISGVLGAPALAAEPVGRADVLAARARLEAARRQIEVHRAGTWEDVAIGLSYEHEKSEDAGAGLERDNFLGLKIGLPLPWRRTNRARIAEAEVTAVRRGMEVEALQARLRAEAAAGRGEMAAAVRVYERVESVLLPQARQLEDRFLAAYGQGQAALTDVLRSRESRLGLEVTRLGAQRDFHLARLRWQAAVDW